MTRTKIIAVIVGAAIISFAWGSYRWHQGFGMGADATLCIISIKADGSAFAMRQRYCLAIKNKTTPYFPDSLRPEGPPYEPKDMP